MNIWENENKKTTETELYKRIRNMDSERIEEYIKWFRQSKMLTFTHVIERHLNVSDDDMQARILEEHKGIVSTFIGDVADLMEAIEDAIADEIRTFPECFFGWIFNHEYTDDYEIPFHLPKNIKGYYFLANNSHDWKSKGHLVCSEGKICLLKTDISGEDFDLRNAFPDPNE